MSQGKKRNTGKKIDNNIKEMFDTVAKKTESTNIEKKIETKEVKKSLEFSKKELLSKAEGYNKNRRSDYCKHLNTAIQELDGSSFSIEKIDEDILQYRKGNLRHDYSDYIKGFVAQLRG